MGKRARRLRRARERIDMAKVALAPGFENISGLVGGMLFRRFLGMNIIYAKPKRVRQPNTPAQRYWKRKFREGAAEIKRLREEDPVTWAAYVAEARKRHTTAFSLAMRDWLKPPEETVEVAVGADPDWSI